MASALGISGPLFLPPASSAPAPASSAPAPASSAPAPGGEDLAVQMDEWLGLTHVGDSLEQYARSVLRDLAPVPEEATRLAPPTLGGEPVPAPAPATSRCGSVRSCWCVLAGIVAVFVAGLLLGGRRG